MRHYQDTVPIAKANIQEHEMKKHESLGREINLVWLEFSVLHTL